MKSDMIQQAARGAAFAFYYGIRITKESLKVDVGHDNVM